MPAPIGFFPITVYNTVSILHTCINSLLKHNQLEKKKCGSSPLRAKDSKQKYLLRNHLSYCPKINCICFWSAYDMVSREPEVDQWAAHSHYMAFSVPSFHIPLQTLTFFLLCSVLGSRSGPCTLQRNCSLEMTSGIEILALAHIFKHCRAASCSLRPTVNT